MPYSAIRHSKFRRGHVLHPPRARSFRSRGAPANGRLTPSRIGGTGGSGVASRGRRQSPVFSSTDEPSRLRADVGRASRRDSPRFGYRAQGRGPITSLATAVGVTSSSLLSTLALFSHPFDPLPPETDDSENFHSNSLSTHSRSRTSFPLQFAFL